ncbi:MAG: phasin family protein [Gammaproteobacteria bacterium]
MNPVIENIVQPVVNRSLNLASMGIKNTRRLAANGSDLFDASTNTVAFASDKALKLNKITHKTLAKLLSEQTSMLEGTLHAAAKRLDVAANAESLQDLWADQMDLMPKSRNRLTRDAKKVINVLVDTREELSELVSDTVSEFGNRGQSVAQKASKAKDKVVKEARKKTTKAKAEVVKKARKKTATVKKAAKKTTRRASKTAKKTRARKS